MYKSMKGHWVERSECNVKVFTFCDVNTNRGHRRNLDSKWAIYFLTEMGEMARDLNDLERDRQSGDFLLYQHVSMLMGFQLSWDDNNRLIK